MSLFDQPDPATSDRSASGPAPWIHAHCDGGARGNPGPAGFGAVITDANGQTLAELSGFLGIRTNNFAEYSGLLAVLAWALENNYPRLKVVSDSELMVRQIQGRYKVNSPDLKPLWQQARDRIARLDAFEISHALRHKNKAADALANAAMDRGHSTPASSAPRTPAPARSEPAKPAPTLRSAAQPPSQKAPGNQTPSSNGEGRPSTPAMYRGFTRGGAVHLLGSATLPDGIFVKIIPE